jgi:fructose-bisphosphate aldolase class 1
MSHERECIAQTLVADGKEILVVDETVPERLDGLRDRLSEYHAMGARFAKWRTVTHITDTLPSRACVTANVHALARYAALCQEQRFVPNGRLDDTGFRGRR